MSRAAPSWWARSRPAAPATTWSKKQAVYLRNEVCEYIVWRVLDRAIDWFIRRDGQYERLEPGADGILRSEVFPGLWLDPAAMIGGDSARVLAVALQGIGSAEHAEFVAQLGAAAPHVPDGPAG